MHSRILVSILILAAILSICGGKKTTTKKLITKTTKRTRTKVTKTTTTTTKTTKRIRTKVTKKTTTTTKGTTTTTTKATTTTTTKATTTTQATTGAIDQNNYPNYPSQVKCNKNYSSLNFLFLNFLII